MVLPKGMKEYAPSDAILRENMIETIKQTYRLYGFVPVDTPALQKLDVLTAKSGEGIAGEIFKIENSDLGLRFDLTVPFARFAANSDLPRPLKRYVIDKVWRREQPQHMRLREFYQADADIVGSSSNRCEVELITMANDALKKLGVKATFYINSRKILDAWMKYREIKHKDEVLRIIDKLDKIGINAVKQELEAIGEDGGTLVSDLKMGLSDCRAFAEDEVNNLQEIMGATNADTMFSFSLVRGLGYYTGTIFEIKTRQASVSIGGGGRYDNLLQYYGRPDPAVGISIGVERVFQLLKEQNKDMRLTTTKVFVAPLVYDDPQKTNTCFRYGMKFANALRKHEIPTEIDLCKRKMNKQLIYANRQGIPYVVIVGADEVENQMVKLKDMREGIEESLYFDEAVKRMVEYE